MLRKILASILRSKIREPIVDPYFGQLYFDARLGWTGEITLEGSAVKCTFGSAGEVPDEAMLIAAQSTIAHWTTVQLRLREFIASRSHSFSEEDDVPKIEELQPESLNYLWNDSPELCMIQFESIGNDDVQWHVTLDGQNPIDFSFDH